MKKILGLFVLALVASAILAGCEQKSTAPSTTPGTGTNAAPSTNAPAQ